jgi:FixJ family two-component response regulator
MDPQSTLTTVAVVDDDGRVLRSVKNLLESAGFLVCAFASAQELLDSGILPTVACIISDITMPGVDGFELETLVTRQRPAMPVIFITAQDESAWAGRALPPHSLSRSILKKPFSGVEFLALVRAASKADSIAKR